MGITQPRIHDVYLTLEDLAIMRPLDGIAASIMRSEANSVDMTPLAWLCCSAEERAIARERAVAFLRVIRDQDEMTVRDAERIAQVMARAPAFKTLAKTWRKVELELKRKRAKGDATARYLPRPYVSAKAPLTLGWGARMIRGDTLRRQLK